MKSVVVNMRQGQRYDVRIDRQTKWGNPFVMGRDGDREEVVRKYREYLLKTPEGNELVRQARRELRGKRLGCWCAPEACHGDVLIQAAYSEPRS